MRARYVILGSALAWTCAWSQIAPGQDSDALGAACTSGDREACYELGLNTVNGHLGVTADPVAGQRLLARACALGLRKACADTTVKSAMDPSVPMAGQTAMYEADCGKGDLVACSRLGNLLSGVKGVPADLKRARALQKRACDGGAPIGCANLGFMVEEGVGGPSDPAKARRLYARACKAGNMGGCNSMGVLYKEGKHVKRDLPRARGYFERACARDEPRACNNLAEFHAFGVAGLTVDWYEAIRLYTKTCDARSRWGCDRLASIYQGTQGVPRRYHSATKVVVAYAKACALGNGTACYNAGVQYELGTHVTRDMPRAVALYASACELSEPSGCFNHGNELYKGESTPRDVRKAVARWERACALNHPRACEVMEQVKRQGGAP